MCTCVVFWLEPASVLSCSVTFLCSQWRLSIPVPLYAGLAPFGSLPPPGALTGVQLFGGPGHTSISPHATGANTAHSEGPSGSHPLLPPVLPSGLPGFTSSAAPGVGDLSLSMSARPIPARMVQQIRTGRFVEMRDLLYDNIAVRNHFEDLHGAMGMQLIPVSARPRVREVTSLPTWVCCFLTYLAVGTSDQSTRDKLTYATLLIREALKHGGQGWLEYDRLFRQQAALNPGLPWNIIHPGLQASTILGRQPTGAGVFCSLCQSSDHHVAQCALAQLQQPALRNTQPVPLNPSRPGKICSSWNDGACSYPGTCTYCHVCYKCFCASHRAKDCRVQPKGRPGTGTSQGKSSDST